MATEPKVTKLAPGEGAGSFKRKQGPDKPKQGGENTRSRTPKGQRRTQNPAILSDGSVDPKSKQYQRSVAGREKLEDYVKRLDSQGVEERDIFMAAVKSLTNRGHGYVGAYLDSKNPNRRYNDSQAKAIADSVMSKADVGSNPGARLTGEESDESRDARAEKRAASKESGSAPEPRRKAMPIRQQRREVVGQRKDDKGKIRDVRGRGESALGMPETWAKGDTGVDLTTKEARERERTGWKDFEPAVSDAKRPELSKKSQQQQEQRGKKKERGGKEEKTPETAAQRFQKSLRGEPEPTREQGEQLDELLAKRDEMDPEEWGKAFAQLMEAVKTGEGGQREALREYIQGIKGKGVRAPLPGSGAAADRDEAIEKEQAAGKEQQELRQKQAQAGKERAKERRQKQKEAEEERRIEEEIPVDEESGDLGNTVDPVEIGDKFRELFRANIKAGLSTDPQSLVEETVEILNDDYGASLNVDDAMRIVSNRFGARGIDGRRIQFPAQEAQGPKTTTEEQQPETPSAPAEQPQPPAEQATPPARKKLDSERLGAGGSLPAQRGGGGITPEATTKAKTAIEQAVDEGKTAQQLIEEYRQGTLFPGGVVTDTAATNPLEGGSTPEPTQESPELAPSSALPDESRPVAESPGQKTFLKKGSETGKKPQILPSSIQVPKPAQGVTDAKSYTKQLVDAGIPPSQVNKAVSKAFPPRSAKKRKGTTSSSEYQQFSDAVRQVVKLRSTQLVSHR
jgi:hypothetical protein